MLPPPHHTLMPFTKHLCHPLLPTYIASFFVTRITGHKYRISGLPPVPSPVGVKSSNLRSFLLKSHTYDLAAFQLTRLVIFNVPFRVISPGHWVPLTMPTPFNQRRQVKRPFPAGSPLSLFTTSCRLSLSIYVNLDNTLSSGCIYFWTLSPFHIYFYIPSPANLLSVSPLASAQASLPPSGPPRGITTTPSPIFPLLCLHLILSLLPLPAQLISVGRAPSTDCGAGQDPGSAPTASEHHRCHHTLPTIPMPTSHNTNHLHP